MITVTEALHHVLEHSHAKPPGEVALADAGGLVLAEDVTSDIDSPPHTKSMVDGYAVRSSDLIEGRARLIVTEEVTAGAVPQHAVVSGHAARIMTGAPLPDGADSVVMIELTNMSGPNVEIQDTNFRSGQNVIPRGQSLKCGETVLRRGVELGPAEIGLLAEVGRSRVQAIGPVRVAILSTGNELVPANDKPAAGQIRNSNGPLLVAACRRTGAIPIDLGIARDETEELHRLISAGLENDVLVISGGVSAGVLDLVQRALADLGVRQVFHKIRLKPGKPLWFGVCDSALRGQQALVFGLPGNPVSSLVCFELFVKTAIARIAGRHWEPPHSTQSAKLTREFQHRGDRPTYHPARLVSSLDERLAEPLPWQGSSDICGFVGANALIVFPSGDRRYQPGDSVEVIRL